MRQGVGAGSGQRTADSSGGGWDGGDAAEAVVRSGRAAGAGELAGAPRAPPPPRRAAGPSSSLSHAHVHNRPRRRDTRLVKWKATRNERVLEDRVARYDPNKDPLVEVGGWDGEWDALRRAWCSGGLTGALPSRAASARPAPSVSPLPPAFCRPRLLAAAGACNPADATPANQNPQGDPFKTLFIARLSYEVTERHLRSEFERFGPIRHVRIVQAKDKGEQRARGRRGWAPARGARERSRSARSHAPIRACTRIARNVCPPHLPGVQDGAPSLQSTRNPSVQPLLPRARARQASRVATRSSPTSPSQT